ncbi:MAG: LLM class flavin-dependent oxidoreductase [Chloroflexota bacterium]|nr:LLM class flavin-dependent oxidoreductase [Chloroflexota bacterium]
MKFGLSLTGMLQQPAGTDMAGAVEDATGLVRLARELGFSWLYAGQHFLSHPYQMLQPLPVMARLAAEAPGLDLVTTAVLPLHHPVEVAEQVATLDVVSGGHAVLAPALGYRDEENDAFGVPRRDRVGRMTEALEVIDLLWRSESPVTYEGAHFQLREAPTSLRPVRQPSPPVWIAASSDAAVRRTGRLGYPWLINHADYPTIERQVGLYREARAEAGHPAATDLPVLREFFVAESTEEAVRIAQPFVSGKYETYAQWGQDQALEGERSFASEFAALSQERFIVGNVEQVTADLKRYEALGVTHIGLRMRWAGMPTEPTATAMRLTAERVFPAFG